MAVSPRTVDPLAESSSWEVNRVNKTALKLEVEVECNEDVCQGWSAPMTDRGAGVGRMPETKLLLSPDPIVSTIFI